MLSSPSSATEGSQARPASQTSPSEPLQALAPFGEDLQHPLPHAVRMEGAPLRPSFLLLLLLLQPGEYRAAADETELTGILGGSVTFPLRIPAAQKFENGAWMVNTSSLVTVKAGRPPSILVFHSSYKGRLRFSDESYSLQITNLRLEDTGSYAVEFNTDKEQFAYREFTLRVSKGQLPPTIACDSVACKDDACIYTLRCAIRNGRENVTYSWSNTASSVLSIDSIVRIPQRHQATRERVTCTARLPDGNSSTTVSLKEFCAEQVPATTIVCDSVTCANGTCHYSMRCVAGERGGRVAYSWTQEDSGVVVSTGPILRVSVRPFETLPAVICTARHPASNSSRLISPKDLCPDSPLNRSLALSLSYHLIILLLALGALSAGVIA
ncbi:SLAM family member 9-like isoform X2 [Chelonoidis abingdonii]|uniref:SLAM family member 9-like isoform X2 n=2 Tax=Chelonoidis abingdonii TaxID=106734 RepID=UPI0013F27344|nr:T-lymphocyte surface antigen Ly-9-like isoform X2 [Chelonoidis abingdonii]